MTLLNFEVAVASAEGMGESDRVWFPKWLWRYATTFPKGSTDEFPVHRDAVSRNYPNAGCTHGMRSGLALRLNFVPLGERG